MDDPLIFSNWEFDPYTPRASDFGTSSGSNNIFDLIGDSLLFCNTDSIGSIDTEDPVISQLQSTEVLEKEEAPSLGPEPEQEKKRSWRLHRTLKGKWTIKKRM